MARDANPRFRHRAGALAAALLVLAVAVGCAGGARPAASSPSGVTTAVPTIGAAAPTTAPTPVQPTPLAVETVLVGTAGPSPDDEFALDGATALVLKALKSRDAAGLHGLAGAQLQERLQAADYTALAGCLPAGTDVQIEDRDTTIDGDAATVSAHFAVTARGSTTTVQRVWSFARQADGTWKLADVPGCP